MISSDPVRLVIIGSGGIAETHVVAIEHASNAKLVAICARNREKATALAAKYDAQIFETIDALLAWGAFDAVLIATASGVHADAAIPLLQAGKHILCEKPLEVTSERVQGMIDASKKSEAILAGFFPLRFGAGAQAIRKALDEGRFGQLTFISARVKWWRDEAYYKNSAWRGTWKLDGGGALMNQGIHAVDLLQWFGGDVKDVAAFTDALAHSGIEVEDTASASLRFANGALGTIAAGTSCYPGLDLSIEISGDKGTVILVNDRIDFWKFSEERTEDEIIRSGNTGGKIGGGSSDPKAISYQGHLAQIEAFCSVIQGNSTEIISGTEAGKAIAIIEAIYRSSKTKTIQTL